MMAVYHPTEPDEHVPDVPRKVRLAHAFGSLDAIRSALVHLDGMDDYQLELVASELGCAAAALMDATEQLGVDEL